MDFIDARALEFERGRAIFYQMMSHSPLNVHEHLALRDSDYSFLFDSTENENEDKSDDDVNPAIRSFMYMIMAAAPQVLLNRFKALESTVKRFGTWDEAILKPEVKVELSKDGKKTFKDDLDADNYSKNSIEKKLLPIDETLVPSIFDIMHSDSDDISNVWRAEADLDRGNIIWDLAPDPQRPLYRLFGRWFPKTSHFYAHFLDSGMESIKIRMDRWNPIFDPFEPYARRVWVGMPDISGVRRDLIEADIGRDLRPADEPLLYEFTPEAKTLASLPQNETLWRVEAMVGDRLRSYDILTFLGMWHSKASICLGQERIFLEGADRLFDMSDRGEARLAKRAITGGGTIGILTAGEKGDEIAAGVWHAMRDEGIASAPIGGGASSTDCSITDEPMMPEAMAFGANTMAMSAMLAARAGMVV